MVIMKKSLSVIVSALNEEKNIKSAVDAIFAVLCEEGVSDFEILVFNDGSTDRTEQIAKEVSGQDERVKVLHHDQPQGLASIAREATNVSAKENVTWFPGDHSVMADSMRLLFRSMGKADIVAAYVENAHSRSFLRRHLSEAFTFIINSCFGLHLKYFNGASIFSVKMLKEIEIKSDGYGFFAEIFVRALKLGYSYVEVPFAHRPDPETKSKAVSFCNFLYVLKTLIVLLVDVYFYRVPNGRRK